MSKEKNYGKLFAKKKETDKNFGEDLSDKFAKWKNKTRLDEKKKGIFSRIKEKREKNKAKKERQKNILEAEKKAKKAQEVYTDIKEGKIESLEKLKEEKKEHKKKEKGPSFFEKLAKKIKDKKTAKLKEKELKFQEKKKEELTKQQKPEKKEITKTSKAASADEPEPKLKKGKQFFKKLFVKKEKKSSISQIQDRLLEAETKKLEIKQDVQEAKKETQSDEITSADAPKEEIKPAVAENKKLNLFQKALSKIKQDKSKGKLGKVEAHLKKSDEKKKTKKKYEEDKFMSNLDLIKKKRQKKKKVKISRYEKLKHLKSYLEKAGFQVSDEPKVSKRINYLAGLLVLIFNIYMVYAAILRGEKIFFIFVQVVASWLALVPATILLLWGTFYFTLDFKIFNRKKQLEEVLPDFLQLTSANINAGMPLDQALWFAVRPRFGVLAKEIEDVAKATMIGEELKDALIDFSKRYESTMLKRTVNLMIVGLEAGGQIGPLLNKIAVDIQETRIIRKDMAASVMTYVIFISFATVVAAPFMFALSNQLLVIIQGLMGNINLPQNTGSSMLSFNFSSESVSLRDYKIFAMSALAMTSFFSAWIISIIQKGNIKEGIKNIPIFIAISLILFIIATKLLGYFLGGII